MVNNPGAASSDVQVAVNAEDNASGVIGGVIESLDGLNAKAAAVAGGGIAALAGALAVDSARAAAQFEDAIIDLQKVAGEDVAAGLEEDIQQMAEDIPLTAEELAGLAEDAARFGIEGEENIQNFVESTAKMSAATTLNANQAGEAFSKLAELTNTPVSEVENLGSSINTLSNNFATSSQEIVDASLRSAGALSQLGFEQTEIFALNSALNEVSESSERSGTRLRRLAQELKDADPKKLAEPLGLSVDEFERLRSQEPDKLIERIATQFAEGGSAADALRDALSTTSRQAVAGLAQNLEGLRNASETSQQSFKDGTSIQEEFSQETDKTTTQLQLLKSQVNNIKRNLGEDLLPAVKDLVSALSGGVDAFSRINEKTDGMAAKMGLAGTAVGGLALAIGGILSLLSGPVIAAVAAVAAAVGGLAVAWKQDFGGIRDKTRTIMTAIRSLIQRTLGVITRLWNQHGQDIIQSVNQVLTLIEFGWNNMGKQIVAVLQETLDVIIAIIEPGLSNLLEVFDLITDLMVGDWSGVWESIKSILDTSLNAIVRLFKESVGLIKAAVKLVIDAILLPFRFVKKQLIGNSIIPDIIDGIVRIFTNAPSRIKNAVMGIADAIFDGLPSVDEMLSFGKEIIDGLVDSIGDGVGRVGDAIGKVAGAIRDNLPGSDAEKGPLSDFTDSTAALGQMPAEGIERNIPRIQRAAQEAAEAASQTTSAAQLGRGDVESALRSADRTDDIVGAIADLRDEVRRLQGDGTDRPTRYQPRGGE